METEEKEVKSVEADKTILAIREEYEKQIQELKEAHQKELEQKLNEQEAKHVKQIRALMTGKQEVIEEEEKDFYESTLEAVRKKFKI